MEKLLQLVQKEKLTQQSVDRFACITDEKNVTHGAIFTIKIKKNTYKVLIPSPHHEVLIAGEMLPSLKTILNHPEAMQLL